MPAWSEQPAQCPITRPPCEQGCRSISRAPINCPARPPFGRPLLFFYRRTAGPASQATKSTHTRSQRCRRGIYPTSIHSSRQKQYIYQSLRYPSVVALRRDQLRLAVTSAHRSPRLDLTATTLHLTITTPNAHNAPSIRSNLRLDRPNHVFHLKDPLPTCLCALRISTALTTALLYPPSNKQPLLHLPRPTIHALTLQHRHSSPPHQQHTLSPLHRSSCACALAEKHPRTQTQTSLPARRSPSALLHHQEE